MARQIARYLALRTGCAATLCLVLAACAGNDRSVAGQSSAVTAPAGSNPAPGARPTKSPVRHANHIVASGGPPQIVSAKQRLQCVPYARQLSNIQIRGDAWTWWEQADGRYRRSHRPTVGSVLVLRRKGASRGHLAVVTQIISDREIVTSHANWLNRGQVHLNTPVRDVSPNNDWSAVKVWCTPGKVMGKSSYPAYGFIYPPTTTAAR